MGPINYIISVIIVKIKRRRLANTLKKLKKKMELKKILECVYKEDCKDQNCPFFNIIQKSDDKKNY